MEKVVITENLANMAWCALVALKLATSDRDVVSKANENVFLVRWLSVAIKQRRFSKDVSPHLQWLLREGQKLGPHASLVPKLEYIWFSCSGDINAQNDLYRLTYAVEKLKELGWVYELVNDNKWKQPEESLEVNKIIVRRSSLSSAFDDHGNQKGRLEAMLAGELIKVNDVFKKFYWEVSVFSDNIFTLNSSRYMP